MDELVQAGLSKNEAVIYTYLLGHANITTGGIIKDTKLANSRVYDALRRLQNKGLVTYAVQKEGKHFSAVEPRALLERAEEQRNRLQILVPKLEAIQKTNLSSPPIVAVYEGFDGFRIAFKKIIEDTPENSVIRILGFSQQAYAEQSLRTFITNMNLKSSQKKQRLRVLLDESSREGQAQDRKKEPYSETRYLPKGFVSPAAVDILDDAVYTFLWEKEPYVFVIRNKTIAKSYQNYFDALWKGAKGKKKVSS